MEMKRRKRVLNRMEDEQERMREKSRRKAFWGLQIKYTLTPICLLYGIVFAVLLGMFLWNWMTKISNAVGNVTFLAQIGALPLGLTFVILIVGVQILLKISFSKQGKDELALLRIPLPEETRGLLRLEYSVLVTASTFLIYFLMLSALLVLENILEPETAYGLTELYPAFYTFTHLYRIYPVINGMAWAVLPVAIANCAMMAPLAEEVRRKGNIGEAVWIGFAFCTFLFYCFDEGNQVSDFVLMLLYGGVYIGKVLFAYRRRQKDDRAEFV